MRDRSRLALAAGVLAVAAFALLALGGLAVITRYLLLTGTLLSIFCAVAVFGWMLVEPDRASRTAWTIASVAMAVVLIAFAPAQVGRLDDLEQKIAEQDRIQADLRELADSGAFDPGCEPVAVPSTRPVPMLALWLDRRPSEILPAVRERQGDLVEAEPRGGYVVEPGSPAVDEAFELDPNDPGKRTGPVPEGFELVERNRSWELYAACP